jgi:hypothetical protein
MERFFRNDSEFQLLFNCSFYKVSDVPLEKRSNILLGIVFMLFALTEMVKYVYHSDKIANLRILFKVLYLPCLLSIWRHRKESCFKIMFFMGILDLLVLLTYFLPSAYFQIVGIVYCSYPNIVYASGAFGLCEF